VSRLLVLGAGVSGVAAARLATRLGHTVTVYDARPAAAGLPGVAVAVGAWDPLLLSGVDLVVTSPGFSERSAPVVDALEAGLPIIGEVEFAWRHLPPRPCVAVTGTNGKTTVTGLVSEMLERGGVRAPALGNIGTPLSDAVSDPPDVLVVEVSSFQLRFVETFKADAAVLLNLAPDHLDWHGSFAAYAAAKARVFERQEPSDVAVYDADDAGAARLAAGSTARRIPVSGRRLPEGGGGVVEGRLVVGGVSAHLDDLAVSDPAFLLDLAAAAAAAIEAGAAVAQILETWRAFRPGPHRRTLVAELGGVAYVDDSKATNPHAALAAIRSYPSVVLIAGGLAKGLDVTPLVREPNVRRVVALGEASVDLVAADPRRVEAAPTMEAAVRIAAGEASAGDTVLLAPGCASFDMFESYAGRGEAFATAVRELVEERGEERVR
jgi:UDP-N-acetylmuramoylalanine--D-glutamate ligase